MKKTDILPETFFTVTRSGTMATMYKQVVQVQRQQRTNKSMICIYIPYGMFHLYTIYMPIFR